MTTTNEISLPYLNVPKGFGYDLMRLEPEDYERQRFKLVRKCYAANDVEWSTVPDAWMQGPLMAWCWMVLTINGLDPDPEVQKPLVHWGIDLGFASSGLREWIWAIS